MMRSGNADTAIDGSGFWAGMLGAVTDIFAVTSRQLAGISWQLMLQPIVSELLARLKVQLHNLFFFFRGQIIAMPQKKLTLE